MQIALRNTRDCGRFLLLLIATFLFAGAFASRGDLQLVVFFGYVGSGCDINGRHSDNNGDHSSDSNIGVRPAGWAVSNPMLADLLAAWREGSELSTGRVS